MEFVLSGGAAHEHVRFYYVHEDDRVCHAQQQYSSAMVVKPFSVQLWTGIRIAQTCCRRKGR